MKIGRQECCQPNPRSRSSFVQKNCFTYSEIIPRNHFTYQALDIAPYFRLKQTWEKNRKFCKIFASQHLLKVYEYNGNHAGKTFANNNITTIKFILPCKILCIQNWSLSNLVTEKNAAQVYDASRGEYLDNFCQVLGLYT